MKSEEFFKQLSDYYVIKDSAPLSYGVVISGLFITLRGDEISARPDWPWGPPSLL